MKHLIITVGTLLGVWVVALTLFAGLPVRYLLPAAGLWSDLVMLAGLLLTYFTTVVVGEWMKAKGKFYTYHQPRRMVAPRRD